MLTEIWVFSHELCQFTLPGYNLYANCNEYYAAGGTAVLVKNDFEVSVNTPDLESADCVVLELKLGKTTLVLVCVYRLQFVSSEVFLKEIESLLCSINCENLCVIGDINIDILHFPKESDDYVLLLSSLGYQSLINVPTRVFGQSKSCIDHLFLKSRNLLKIFPYVLQLDITDHFMTGMYLKDFLSELSEYRYNEGNTEPIVQVNYIELNQLLSQETWTPVFSCDCPCLAFAILLEKLKFYIDES